MSAKLDSYNAIKSALEDLKVNNSRLIPTVGLWNNQFDNEDIETAFNFPACFIHFANIRWDVTNYKPPRGGVGGTNVTKEQKGNTEEKSLITLHIGFSLLKDPKDSLEILDPILEAIYFAVQGLEGDFFSPILRIEERQDVDHDRVLVWEMDFNTMLNQCGEEDKSLVEIAANTLSLVLTKDLDIDAATTTGVRTNKGDAQP